MIRGQFNTRGELIFEIELIATDRANYCCEYCLLSNSLSMKIKVVIWQEDDVWCASVPGLPGCHTYSDNYEHLIEMLQEAIEGWLEVAST